MQSWALVEFDLSDIIGEDITIDVATFEVYEGQVGAVGKTVACHRIKATWNESTVVWINRPPLGASQLDSIITDGAIGWWVFDVADQVQNWVDGVHDNYGLALVHTPGCTFPYVYSSDYTSNPDLRPKLCVDYSPRTAVEEASWGLIKAEF